jgi:hypothetical protein
MSIAGVAALLALAAGFASPLRAQDDTGASGDTLSIDRDGGSVSIKIDQNGIRVEGSVKDDSDTLAGGRIVFNSNDRRRSYTEKGTEIVKFGEDVFVDADEIVRGDIVVFGGDVTVRGKVVGNVVVMAGDAELLSGAEVNGDVVVLGGMLDESDGVLIHGERVMLKDMSIPIQGVSQFFGEHARFFGFFFVPIQFFISIILSFLIVLFLRDRVTRMQSHVQHGFLKSFGAGFLAVFIGCLVVTFLAVILVITIIGIPLAFVLLVSCIAVFIIARTVFVFALGAKISEKLNVETENPFAIVLVGTAFLYLPALLGYALGVLPFGGPIGGILKGVGALISCFAYLVGLRAIFLSRFGVREALPEEAASVSAPSPQPE